MANLTADETRREELYARAQTEGAGLDIELDPPSSSPPTPVFANTVPNAMNPNGMQAPRETAFDVVLNGMGSGSMAFEASPAILTGLAARSVSFAPQHDQIMDDMIMDET